jgi:site-specific DNA recombinase
LEGRRARLDQVIASVAEPPVRLHPNLAHIYRKKVDRLQQAIGEPEIRDEAIGVLRGLLDRIVITPAQTGFEVEIVGESLR